MIAARRAAVLAVALVLASCGSSMTSAPTPVGPTGSATAGPTASPLPASSASITESGGKVEVPDGPVLSVPPGGLPAGSTVTIAALASPPGLTSALPGSVLGHAWSVDTGGAALIGTATLTLRFDPAALPAGTGSAGVMLAWFDASAGTWARVDATVDPAAGTVAARVGHLSIWAVVVVTAATAGGTFAFPYAAGVVAELGSKGLHDDNFRYLDDRTTSAPAGAGYSLSGAGPPTDTPPGVGDASLDLVVARSGTPVIPLASGTVLAASPYCQTILVDHGGGTWVEYVHLVPTVTAGQHVDRSRQLGTVAPALGSGVTGPCGLQSDAPHVHFAFLKGSGSTGQYVSMAGAVLCGHAVTSSGGIDGLAAGPGQSFTVPSCPGDAAPPTPAPTPMPTPTPRPGATVIRAGVTAEACRASDWKPTEAGATKRFVVVMGTAPIRAKPAIEGSIYGFWSVGTTLRVDCSRPIAESGTNVVWFRVTSWDGVSGWVDVGSDNVAPY